jgi:hypothetical protein
MNFRRAVRQLTRLLVSTESQPGRCLSILASQAHRTAAARTVSAWENAIGPWRSVRWCTSTAEHADLATAAAENKQNVSEAIIRLEAQAMELAAEGHHDKYVHRIVLLWLPQRGP